jgi:hypothetical protein
MVASGPRTQLMASPRELLLQLSLPTTIGGLGWGMGGNSGGGSSDQTLAGSVHASHHSAGTLQWPRVRLQNEGRGC